LVTALVRSKPLIPFYLKRDSCSPDATLRSQEERVVEGGRTEVATEQRGLSP
jgi:hypothetical protein